MADRGGVYRDALEGVRGRLEGLRADVDARRARVTPELFAVVPEALGAALRRLEAETRPASEALDEHLRVERALEAYRDALDEAIRLAPGLEKAYLELPDEVEDLTPKKRGFDVGLLLPSSKQRVEREAAAYWSKLRRLAREIDPRAEVVRSTFYCQARFRAGDDPFAVLAEVAHPVKDFVDVDFAAATSVRRGAPRVAIWPATWTDTFATAFRVRREAEVGDDGFDELFFIDAAPADARRVLTAEVRAALLALGRFDLPHLAIADGRAVLRWTFEPDKRAIQAAVKALAAIRRAPVELQLLAED